MAWLGPWTAEMNELLLLSWGMGPRADVSWTMRVSPGNGLEERAA